MKSKVHPDSDAESLHSGRSNSSAEASSFIAINTVCGRNAERSLCAAIDGACGTLNLTTQRGRNLHMLQILILPLIPVLALVSLNCVNMESVIRYQSEVHSVDQGVTATIRLGELVTAVQEERAEVNYYVYTNGSSLRSNLSRVYQMTDRVVANIGEWPVISTSTDLFLSPQHFQIRLNDFRARVNPNDLRIRSKMEFYTRITEPLIRLLFRSTHDTNTSGLWQLTEAYKSIITSVEHIGRATVYGLNYYGRGHLDQRGLYQYVRLWTIGNAGLKTTKTFAKESTQILIELENEPYIEMIMNWHDEIRHNRIINGSLEASETYFKTMMRYTGDLLKVQSAIRKNIRAKVREKLSAADREEAATIAVLVVVLVLSPVIIVLVRQATTMVQLFSQTLSYKMAQLRKEKRRSDRLLYQMLPPSIACQLKEKKQAPAESFESATVYFCDVVGFTELCAEISPMQVVTLLNSQYRVFDGRLEQYDAYKVETIGDAYMVVSGLPRRNGNRHASEIACLALDLRHSVQSIVLPHKPGVTLQIRAGINTGAVVAGVVGTKMPRYCLFGDTVNTASRMETTGEPMRVQISPSTQLALQAAGGFIIEFRGHVNIKGKGEMATYWLEGRDGLLLTAPDLQDLEPTVGDPAYLALVDDLEDSPTARSRRTDGKMKG